MNGHYLLMNNHEVGEILFKICFRLAHVFWIILQVVMIPNVASMLMMEDFTVNSMPDVLPLTTKMLLYALTTEMSIHNYSHAVNVDLR